MSKPEIDRPSAALSQLAEDLGAEHNLISRRRFFKIAGSGMAVLFSVSRMNVFASGVADKDEGDLDAWIHISADNKVTVYTGKVEVGQNIRTSLAQMVAEELDVPMESIEMIMGDTFLTPYDRGTFGSRSTPYMGPQLRKAAATAREHVLQLAAKKLGAPATTLRTSAGTVQHTGSSRSVTYGQLVQGKNMTLRVRDDIALKPATSWKVAGKGMRKVRGEDFVTGRHKYVSDMRLPGMLYGKILRPPAYGATLNTVDTTAARAMPGVLVVEEDGFIGVCANSPGVASDALKRIKATWNTTSQPSQESLFAYLKSHPEERDDGSVPANVTQAFDSAQHKLSQTFHVDYIAHVPLEPRAGIAQWNDGVLTVWTGTQRPFGVQEELSAQFNLSKDKIRVIMPDTGSGYGGKHTGEAGIEAARLAKGADGKPVKIVWTREEEFTWAYFRPAGVIDVNAGMSSDGKIVAWEFHNYNSGGSGIETRYDIPHKHIRYHACRSPLRQGSYRALAATANTFARECVIDDLAQLIKEDPLAFRLKQLKDERMTGVLRGAAEKFGWTNWVSKPNHGIGIACGDEKGGFVATCVEVSVSAESGRISLVRICVAFECGTIINPLNLENQVAGAVIQGLGGALFESIRFGDGKIYNASLAEYRVPRFSDIPPIDVVLISRTDIAPAGAGETPIVAIAPAIRNAFANATGKRLNTLPLQREDPE